MVKNETRNGKLSEEMLRDPLALSRPDRIALGLIILALVLAPLCAGTFATPPSEGGTGLPDGLLVRLENLGLSLYATLFDRLQTVGIALVAALIAVAVILQVWREWQRPVSIGTVPFLPGATLLLTGWTMVSLLRTQALYLSLNALMALLTALSAATLISRLCRDRKGLTALLIALIVAGALAAVLGVSEYMFAWNPAGKTHDPLHRTAGSFLNPDFLAGYLLLTLPITMAAVVAVSDRTVRLGLGFALTLQSACLMLTGSRAGLIAAAVGIVVWVALCFWSGAAIGRTRRIGRVIGLILLGALLASAPTRSRLAAPLQAPSASPHPSPSTGASNAYEPSPAPVTQSQSLQFRRYTWQGTQNMIQSNPLIGTGLGTFDIAYPRYAITAYTAHAHNSLLQWTSDTGIPGALLLLTALAAATAFAANVLRLRRAALRDGSEPQPDTAGNLFDEPALLLCGILAALIASALKTFFDSDWYIVATVLTLCALLALLVGLARDIAPLSTQIPQPLSREMLLGGVVISLLLLGRAGQTGLSHLDAAQGAQTLQERQPQAALDDFQSAAQADPYDPELQLEIATLYGALGRTDDQRAALLSAIHRAPIAKVWYRMGQFYDANHESAQSISAYQKALSLAPYNLQILRHLAETLDRAGQTDAAFSKYEIMTRLEISPYGTVRAIADEIVETEYAYAHAGLASLAARKQQWDLALQQYNQADSIMQAYWQRRNWLANEGMAPQKREALEALYRQILSGRRDTLRKQGAPPAAIQAVSVEQNRVEEDIRKDQEAQAAANGASR